MGEAVWAEVDEYFSVSLGLADAALEHALATSAAAGLPAISVSAPQGQLLRILARQCGARRILEVGTLGGYSGIWLAGALGEGGKLVTLELDPHHAAVAKENFRHAGVEAMAEVRVGPALETLAAVAAEKAGPFDFTFIDADKAASAQYVERAIALSRPGALIVLDNVVRNGAVLLGESKDAAVQGVRRAIELLGRDPRVEATAIQTVGNKGYDGFALARVR